jgi:hypothetical protein
MSCYFSRCLYSWHRFPADIRLCRELRQFAVQEEASIRNGASGTRGTQCSRYPKRFRRHCLRVTASKDENLAAIAKDDGASGFTSREACSIAMSTEIKSPPVAGGGHWRRVGRGFLKSRSPKPMWIWSIFPRQSYGLVVAHRAIRRIFKWKINWFENARPMICPIFILPSEPG